MTANTDKCRKVNGEIVNFMVYYDIDQETCSHVLGSDLYGVWWG